MKEAEYTGFLVSRTNINDSDRIINIFTIEEGRQAFIAKGVRKPKAKLQSQLEPLVETKYRVLGMGKLPTLVGAKGVGKNNFFEVSIESSLSAMLLTELLGLFAVEGMKNETAYNSYKEALDMFSKDKKIALILNYYILRLLSAFGIEPHITLGLDKYWLNIDEGTVDGASGDSSVSIAKNVARLWNACLTHNPNILDRLKVEELTSRESLNLLINYISQHTDRKIKSAKVLSDSTNLLQAG